MTAAASSARRPPTTYRRWKSALRSTVATSGIAPAGKLIVATATRWTDPLRSRSLACHGPRGSRASSRTATDSESPGARVEPSVIGNGPPRSPPGPLRERQLTGEREPAPAGVVNDRVNARLAGLGPFRGERADDEVRRLGSAGRDRDIHADAHSVHQRHPAASRRGSRYLRPDDGLMLSGRSVLGHVDGHRLECLAHPAAGAVRPTHRRPAGELVSAMAGSKGEVAPAKRGGGRVDRDIRGRARAVDDLDAAADARPGCEPVDDVGAGPRFAARNRRHGDEPDPDAARACCEPTGSRHEHSGQHRDGDEADAHASPSARSKRPSG